MNELRNAWQYTLLFLAGAAPLAFVLAALTRRLNFDESLALRAGWLSVAGIDAAPDFHMPTTLALGALGHQVDDPAAVFAVARVVAASTVLLAGFWALRSAKLPSAFAALTVVLCFAQAAFAVHGYEFRYDWGILIAWLGAFGLLQRRTRNAYLALGVCVAWLFAHHLKGAFFGASLYAVCLAAIFSSRERRAPLLALHAGLVVTGLAWVTTSFALGMGAALTGVYSTFLSLAAEETKVWPNILGGEVSHDLIWWIVSALAVLVVAAREFRELLTHDGLESRARAAVSSNRAWALWFALVPLAFLFVHPHPWPYMLALPAPFLALVMAFGWEDLTKRYGAKRAPTAFAVIALSVLVFGAATGRWPGDPYVAALSAPNTAQVETLRLLARESRADERVIDPSGMAYFLPPCTDEWYLDTLFAERASRGRWMADLPEHRAADCPWVVNTYRLEMIPESMREPLTRGYELQSGGLSLPHGDERLASGDWPELAHSELESFWW